MRMQWCCEGPREAVRWASGRRTEVVNRDSTEDVPERDPCPKENMGIEASLAVTRGLFTLQV